MVIIARRGMAPLRERSRAQTVRGCKGPSRLVRNLVRRTIKPSAVMSSNRQRIASERWRPVTARSPKRVE